MSKLKQYEIDQAAIKLVQDDIQNNDRKNIQITTEFSIDIDDEIRTARRHYEKVFTEPNDEDTGREKTFVGLIQTAVDDVVKNIDIDTKNISIKGNHPAHYGLAQIMKLTLLYWFKKILLGEKLNEWIKEGSIDGTLIVKTFKDYDKELQKKILATKTVDPLNFYINPYSENCQSAPAETEKANLLINEINKKWRNIKTLEGMKKFSPSEDIQVNSVVPTVTIYERWGLMPEYFITKSSDDNDWIEGVIIYSKESDGKVERPLVHYLNKNTHPKGYRPNEEWRYSRRTRLFWGKGVPAILKHWQKYINTIINVRENTALISQNLLFLFRIGSGLSQKDFSRLITGGAIPVSDIDRDVKQLQVNDYKASNYKDEQVADDWGRKETGTYESSTGATISPNQPATTTAIQDKNAKSGYGLTQENFGLFLSRLIRRHFIPTILDTMNDEELVRISGSVEELKELDKVYIDHIVNTEAIKYYEANGFYPAPDEMEMQKAKAMKKFGQTKGDRYVQILKKLFKDADFDVEINVTDENTNDAFMVQQLTQLASSYVGNPELANLIMRAIFNITSSNSSILDQIDEVIQRQKKAMPAQGMPKVEEMMSEKTNMMI
ncbi:MAG: hypothetical protein WC788_08160 [Candidatus Paceibacterota bacterium]|jgi:hypothetical protein